MLKRKIREITERNFSPLQLLFPNGLRSDDLGKVQSRRRRRRRRRQLNERLRQKKIDESEARSESFELFRDEFSETIANFFPQKNELEPE